MNAMGATKKTRYHTIEGMASPNFGPRHLLLGVDAYADDMCQPAALAFILSNVPVIRS